MAYKVFYRVDGNIFCVFLFFLIEKYVHCIETQGLPNEKPLEIRGRRKQILIGRRNL